MTGVATFNFMDLKKTLFLSIGIVLTFLGMMALRVIDNAGANPSTNFILLISAVVLIVTGIHCVVDVVGKLDDNFLFSFFRKMERSKRFSSKTYLIAIAIVVLLSFLGFLASPHPGHAALASLMFSTFFPLLVLVVRYRNRVSKYRQLSSDVDKELMAKKENKAE